MAQKKKFTIEKLALMAQNGFSEIHEEILKVRQELSQKPDKAELVIKADKSDIALLADRISRVSDKIDDYRADQSFLKRQVDKHEKWHYQTAEKIGIKLEN